MAVAECLFPWKIQDHKIHSEIKPESEKSKEKGNVIKSDWSLKSSRNQNRSGIWPFVGKHAVSLGDPLSFQ